MQNKSRYAILVALMAISLPKADGVERDVPINSIVENRNPVVENDGQDKRDKVLEEIKLRLEAQNAVLEANIKKRKDAANKAEKEKKEEREEEIRNRIAIRREASAFKLAVLRAEHKARQQRADSEGKGNKENKEDKNDVQGLQKAQERLTLLYQRMESEKLEMSEERRTAMQAKIAKVRDKLGALQAAREGKTLLLPAP